MENSFKKHIQKIRCSVDKTQKEVAKSVGITEVCYQQYEYGKRIPSATVAIRIADVLETTVEDIWGAKRL